MDHVHMFSSLDKYGQTLFYFCLLCNLKVAEFIYIFFDSNIIFMYINFQELSFCSIHSIPTSQ